MTNQLLMGNYPEKIYVSYVTIFIPSINALIFKGKVNMSSFANFLVALSQKGLEGNSHG